MEIFGLGPEAIFTSLGSLLGFVVAVITLYQTVRSRKDTRHLPEIRVSVNGRLDRLMKREQQLTDLLTKHRIPVPEDPPTQGTSNV